MKTIRCQKVVHYLKWDDDMNTHQRSCTVLGKLEAAGVDVCLVDDDVKMLICLSKQKLRALTAFS